MDLTQQSPHCILLQGIGVDDELFVEVRIRAEGGIGYCSLCFLERTLLFLPPDEWHIIFCQICDWGQDLCSTGNVILDEIDGSKEPSNLFDIVRPGEFENGLDSLSGWHESSLLQEEPKKFDLSGTELTFLRLTCIPVSSICGRFCRGH